MTTIERTAFDLAGAARQSRGRASRRAGPATRFKGADVLELAGRHPACAWPAPSIKGARPRRRGAQSPKETWLRLLLVDAGFPRPQTQIPVLAPDGYPRYFLDMGWTDLMVAVEYDGEQHRVDTSQYRGDVARSEYLESLGWRRIRVVAGDRAADIVRRVERVWPR